MLYDKKRWDKKIRVKKPKELTAEQRLILDAIEEINKRGWCQGVAWNAAGEVCLSGALSLAGGVLGKRARLVGERVRSAAHRRVRRAINGDIVSWWNDKPGRTKEEVIAVLRKAADVERAR